MENKACTLVVAEASQCDELPEEAVGSQVLEVSQISSLPQHVLLRSWVSANTCHQDGLVGLRNSLARNVQVWNKPGT